MAVFLLLAHIVAAVVVPVLLVKTVLDQVQVQVAQA